MGERRKQNEKPGRLSSPISLELITPDTSWTPSQTCTHAHTRARLHISKLQPLPPTSGLSQEEGRLLGASTTRLCRHCSASPCCRLADGGWFGPRGGGGCGQGTRVGSRHKLRATAAVAASFRPGGGVGGGGGGGGGGEAHEDNEMGAPPIHHTKPHNRAQGNEDTNHCREKDSRLVCEADMLRGPALLLVPGVFDLLEGAISMVARLGATQRQDGGE